MRTSCIIVHLLLAVYALNSFSSVPPLEAREQLLDSLEKEMTKLMQRVGPSVVSVAACCRTPQCQTSRMTRSTDSALPTSTNASLWQTNIGSGCIIDVDGHIVTTENVIHDAHEFEVTFSDGTKRIAQRIGSDPESNIAVLKVVGNGYTPATMGDSEKISVGSLITILGNSFGLSSAVSFGFVNGIRNGDELIQMSVPVSPGNSGAVALNTKGEVIGLVVAAVSEPVTLTIGAPGTQQQHIQQLDLPSQGASLAIPSNKVQRIATELIEHGVYERGWLGVTIRNLTQAQAKKLQINSGVLVIDVLNPSPASEAQIGVGDVILQYDGKKVTKAKELFERVQSSEVGKTVSIMILRKGQEHTLETEIIQRPVDLKERMAKSTGLPQHFDTSDPPIPSQPLLSNESIEKRIDLLEEEIRQLRKLIRKEQ